MLASTDALLDTLALASGVHAVRVSDGLVFLDIERDGYFCLYAPADAVRDDSASLETIRAQLFAHGLIANRSARRIDTEPQPHTRLWRESDALERPSLEIRALWYFLAALLRAAWRFRRASLAQLIAHTQGHAPASPRSSAAVVTARFERLCLWLPFRFACLFRSFFLLHFLHSYGLRADWVFGVSLFPFHAHCWLAEGDLLLGERVGKVEGFATIFQIERASA